MRKDINRLVVAAGHQLDKKEAKALKLRTASYVLNTNVHCSTGLNLLWDSMRKCLNTVEKLQ